MQHTAHVLFDRDDGGAEAASSLVREMGSMGEQARNLAYWLFEVCTRKGWAAEALVYNELAQEWPKLEDLAASSPKASAPAQSELAL